MTFQNYQSSAIKYRIAIIISANIFSCQQHTRVRCGQLRLLRPRRFGHFGCYFICNSFGYGFVQSRGYLPLLRLTHQRGPGNSALPSFDIAAMMYHADIAALSANTPFDLSVLAETQRYLDYMEQNSSEAKKLTTPDGSRIIFDTEKKLAGLMPLSIEMDDLAKEVVMEQNPFLGSSPTISDNRATTQEARV